MTRRKDITPMTQLELAIPQTWRARLDLYLYSELEGRIPKGAYKSFFLARLVEFFTFRRVDLSPWGVEGSISGSPETITKVLTILEANYHGKN